MGWLAWCICNTVRGLLGGEPIELQKYIPQFNVLEKPLTEEEQIERDRRANAMTLEANLMAAFMNVKKEAPKVELR